MSYTGPMNEFQWDPNNWQGQATQWGADPAVLAEATAILDQYLGKGYYSDPGNLQEVLSGRETMDQFAYDTMLRGLPTASGGGTGGDADIDGDGRIDQGWQPNAGGQAWVWGGQGSAPSASNNGQGRQTPANVPSRADTYAMFQRAMGGHRQPENNPNAWGPGPDPVNRGPQAATSIAPASTSILELYEILARLGLLPQGVTVQNPNQR